jgi:hypothetical protein
MDKLVSAPLIVALAVIVFAAPANAGPCGEEVAALRATLPQNPKVGSVGDGSAPQSVGAQLGHQPTPESIARAEQSALSKVANALSRADAFDAADNQRACRHALSKARLLLNP